MVDANGTLSENFTDFLNGSSEEGANVGAGFGGMEGDGEEEQIARMTLGQLDEEFPGVSIR